MSMLNVFRAPDTEYIVLATVLLRAIGGNMIKCTKDMMYFEYCFCMLAMVLLFIFSEEIMDSKGGCSATTRG